MAYLVGKLDLAIGIVVWRHNVYTNKGSFDVVVYQVEKVLEVLWISLELVKSNYLGIAIK